MRIAVLDANLAEATQLCDLLSAVSYTSRAFSEGAEFLRCIGRDVFDLVLLAWNLPDISAKDLLRRIQQSPLRGVPLMIMGSDAEATEVAAMLSAGADDYVVRPVSLVVLLARVDALLRRAYRFNALAGDSRLASATFEEFEFDFDFRKVMRSGKVIPLTQKEFDLAVLFFRHLNRPVSRTHILEHVWNVTGDGISTRTADTHVSALRTKLGLRSEHGYRLLPLYGYGYILERTPGDARGSRPRQHDLQVGIDDLGE